MSDSNYPYPPSTQTTYSKGNEYYNPPPPPSSSPIPYAEPYCTPYSEQYSEPTPVYAVGGIIGAETNDMETINDWSHNLCDCLDDFPICLSGLCCGGFMTSTIHAKVENRQPEMMDHCLGCILCLSTYGFGLWCCQSLVEYKNRRELEQLLNMKTHKEENGKDMCISCCCLPCITCQHLREFKQREKTGEIKFNMYN